MIRPFPTLFALGRGVSPRTGAIAALAAWCFSLNPVAAQVFTDVGILDLERGDLLAERTVVVEAGEIVAIGDRGIVPAGATILDGAGLTLMPGLVDMHVHLEWFPSPDVLPLFLLYGVTTVRQMDGRTEHLAWRDQVAAGELLGPYIHVGGRILEGPDPQWDDTRVVSTEAEARAAVREQSELGYDFVKVYHTLTPELYRAILDEAGNAGLRIAGHPPRQLGWSELLSGIETIEHLTSLVHFIQRAGAQPAPELLHLGRNYFAVDIDPRKRQSIIEDLARSGVAVTPTLSIQERFLSALSEEHPDVSHAWALTEDVEDFWFGVHEWLRDELDDGARETAAEGVTRKRSLLRDLHEAGVRLFVGTDTPQPFLVPGASLIDEIEAFVDAGIPVVDVLRLATSGPSAFIDDLVGGGTVEEGQTANFVLLRGNPLEDLGALRRVEGLMVKDRWITRAALLAQMPEENGSR